MCWRPTSSLLGRPAPRAGRARALEPAFWAEPRRPNQRRGFAHLMALIAGARRSVTVISPY